jgi:hypothetical protein
MLERNTRFDQRYCSNRKLARSNPQCPYGAEHPLFPHPQPIFTIEGPPSQAAGRYP